MCPNAIVKILDLDCDLNSWPEEGHLCYFTRRKMAPATSRVTKQVIIKNIFCNMHQSSIISPVWSKHIFFQSHGYFSMIPINQAYQGGTLMLFWEHPLVMENSGPRAQQKQKNLVTVKMVIKIIKYWLFFRSSTTDTSTVWILCLTSSLLLWRRKEKEKKELMYN